MKIKKQPIIRLHLWLETDKGLFFGLGRMKILKCIHEGQSLKGAAESLGMSYRAAWGKIKKTEKVIGVKLVEKKKGNRSGYELTPKGQELMNKFNEWFEEVEFFAFQRAKELLPFNPIGFNEAHQENTGVKKRKPNGGKTARPV
jgi:molybdate transport system regulatory protein